MYNSPKCPPPCEPCNPCKEPVRREQPTCCGPADCTPVGNVYDIQGMKPIPPCPAPGPGYMIPSMRPEIRNMTESQQVQELTKRVDCLTQAINDYSKNVYGAYNTIVNSALCNDAYYDEIKQQTGYIEANNCYYTLVDIPFVDCANQPIYLELALAYNNTQNMGVTEDILDASYHLVADKMVPASSGPFVENNITTGWDGLVFYGGAPISNPTHQVNWTIATTANGFIKLYPNTTDRTVMQNDRVMDAMGCMSVLVNNGVATPNLYGTDAGQPKARVAIGMNYKTKHRFIVVTDGTDTIGSTSSDLSNIFVNLGCDVAAEVCTGAKAVGLDKGMFMYTPATKDDNGAPTSPKECAFWFITKCRHYKNQYVRDVAELTQNVGKQTWQATLANLNVSDMWVEVGTLNKKLTQEIADREQGDATLDSKIDQEISDREQADSDISSKLEQEISDRTDADTELREDIETETTVRETKDNELQEAINAEETARENADNALAQTIAAETAARTEADAALQEDVYNIKESYLPLAGGTMDGPIDMNGQTIDSLPEPSEADHAVNKQYVDNADAKLEDAIEEKLPLTGGTMKGAINMNGQSITNLADAANDGDAVSKKYMENALEDYLPTNGGTMNGAINMGNHTITNVAKPVNGTDAANKGYVDSLNYFTAQNNPPDAYLILKKPYHSIQVNSENGLKSGYLFYDQLVLIERDSADSETGILTVVSPGEISFGDENTGVISGLANPNNANDAANKAYVDAQVASADSFFTEGEIASSQYIQLKPEYSAIRQAVTLEDIVYTGDITPQGIIFQGSDTSSTPLYTGMFTANDFSIEPNNGVGYGIEYKVGGILEIYSSSRPALGRGNSIVIDGDVISFYTNKTTGTSGIINGLANPTLDNQAANKAYVDQQSTKMWSYFNTVTVNSETTTILEFPSLESGNWFVNVFIDYGTPGSFEDHYAIALMQNGIVKVNNFINSKTTYLESANTSFIAYGKSTYSLFYVTNELTKEYNLNIRIIALNITGHWTNDPTHPYSL